MIVDKFVNKVRLGLFLGGISDSVSVLALLAGTVLLVFRFLGIATVPFIYSLLFLPLVILWCLWRVRAVPFSKQAGAVHVDRTLGLEGLLIASQEADASSWSEKLKDKIQKPERALPKLNIKRLLARPVLPLLFLGGISLLPEPSDSPPVPNPLAKRELDQLDRELAELRQEKFLTDQKGKELEEKLQKLQKKLQSGGAVEWSDVDRLGEELSFEKTVEAEELEKTEALLSEFINEGKEKLATGKKRTTATQKAFQKAVAEAEKAGILDSLSEELSEHLAGALQPDGSFDLSKLTEAGLPEDLTKKLTAMLSRKLKKLQEQGTFDPSAGTIDKELLKSLMRHRISPSSLPSSKLTPEQMRQLARLLREASRFKLAKLAEAGRIDPEKLARLNALLKGELKPGGT